MFKIQSLISRILFCLLLLVTDSTFAQFPQFGEDQTPAPSTNTAVDYSRPITVTVQNNTPVDLTPIVMVQDNISPEDVNRLINTTLFAHSERTFLFNRTGYPAQLV